MGGGPTKALCGVGDPGTDMRKMAQRGLPSCVVEKEYVMSVLLLLRWRRPRQDARARELYRRLTLPAKNCEVDVCS